MISLVVYALVLVLAFAGSAAAVTGAARAVGSNRARFRTGLAATVTIAVVELLLASLTLAVSNPPTLRTVVAAALTFVGSVAAQWMILRCAFGLTRPQTWAPFGARLATGLVIVLAVLGIVRPYLAESFVLPTVSMSPGIEPGDRFIVEKLTRDPRRWDVIVYFVAPQLAGSAQSRGSVKWCKRVVGLPGERLVLKDGALYVNDVAVAPPVAITGRYHLSASPGIYNEGDMIQLGRDEFFVIGDNVERSADSRMHGPVKRSDIVGIVDLRYWPPRRAGFLR